jgi:DNA repair protein RecO (recombination protein O)
MTSFSTPALILRRRDYGDFDLILSLLTPEKGKLSAIAKSAKKSTKRFGGVLELFSVLQVVCSSGRRAGLPLLQEAVLKHPFTVIRADILRTAYASYWIELIDAWLEEGQPQRELFALLLHVLGQLDQGRLAPELLSILFQIRFLLLSGHRPNLRECCICHRGLADFETDQVFFELTRGSVACSRCLRPAGGHLTLSKGAVKQLQWLESGPLEAALRLRFSAAALNQSLQFLETFLPYHLGKEPKSLKFIRRMRKP